MRINVKKVIIIAILLQFLTIISVGFYIGLKDHPFSYYKDFEYIRVWNDCLTIRLPENYILDVNRDGFSYLYHVNPDKTELLLFENWNEVTGEPILVGMFVEGSFDREKLYLRYSDIDTSDHYLVYEFYSGNKTIYSTASEFMEKEAVSDLNWIAMNDDSYEMCTCRLIAMGKYENLNELKNVLSESENIDEFLMEFGFFEDNELISIRFDVKWPIETWMIENNWLSNLSAELNLDVCILEYNVIKMQKSYYEFHAGDLTRSLNETVDYEYSIFMDELIPYEYDEITVNDVD